MKKFLYEGSRIQIVEKRSKFIAESFVVKNAAECEEILMSIRKKYYDATHNCYAYRINENEKKCSDDGEPSKTAGYPILDVIDRNNINQCLIVVTRYFGGILLGTGGLVHAYSDSANKVLLDSKIIDVNDGYKIIINCSYENYGKVQYVLNEMKIFINSSNFTDIVEIEIYLEKIEIEKLKKELMEIYRSDQVFGLVKNVNYAILDGKLIEYDSI